jgi:hypothetical protein
MILMIVMRVRLMEKAGAHATHRGFQFIAGWSCEKL